MSDLSKFPSAKIEPLILALAYKDLPFFLGIKKWLNTSNKVDKSFFTEPKIQMVFNILCSHYDKYEKMPLQKTLLSKIDSVEKWHEDEKLYCSTIVNNMINEDISDANYIKEQTIQTIKAGYAYDNIMVEGENIANGELSVVIKELAEINNISFDEDLGTSILDVNKNIHLINDVKNEQVVKTGFPKLTRDLGGGFYPKELTVFAGISGGGKTLWLGNLAINAFLDGKKVLIYTFETSIQRLLTRYYENIGNLQKTEILSSPEYAETKMKNALNITDSKGDLIIKEYNANAVNSNDLLSHISKLKEHKNWIPDIIFVDYLLIMNANNNKTNVENSYKYYKTVAEELRNVSKTLNVPVVTAVQLNRDAMGVGGSGTTKPNASAKNTAESIAIQHTADVYIGIGQTEEEKTLKKYRLFIDKCRNEETGKKLIYNIDWKHMLLKEK